MSLTPRSQYTRVYCDTNCPQPSLLQYTSLQPAYLSHNTLGVLRYSLSHPHALSSLQYNNCIAILSSQPPSLAIHSCNTISTSLGHITIQILLSQYDLGSSPSKFLLHIFFHYYYYYYFHFQLLENYKIYIYIYIPVFFFIFQNIQINL